MAVVTAFDASSGRTLVTVVADDRLLTKTPLGNICTPLLLNSYTPKQISDFTLQRYDKLLSYAILKSDEMTNEAGAESSSLELCPEWRNCNAIEMQKGEPKPSFITLD